MREEWGEGRIGRYEGYTRRHAGIGNAPLVEELEGHA
jgi:hypothetical protein